jgi:hypothetical protein
MVALALTTGALTACSGSPDSSGEELPQDVSVPVGGKGGIVKTSGVTLDIPEGALDKTLQISAKNIGQTAPKELNTKQLSDVYEFGPEGTKFQKDVTITFPNKSMNEKAEVYFTTEDGKAFEKIPSERDGDVVRAKVKHFSRGFLGVPLDEADEPDAATEDASSSTQPDASDIDAGSASDAGVEVDARAELDAAPTPDATTAPDATTPTDAGSADASGPTDADTGPSAMRIVIRSKDVYGVAVNQTWAAFQDGDGEWLPLPTPTTAGHYELDVTSPRFNVAFVCSSKDLVNSWGTVHYLTATATMFDVVTEAPPCTVGTAAPVYTLAGNIAMGADTYLRHGHAHEASGIIYTGIGDYLMGQLVRNEVDDLVFISGPSAYGLSRILVVRDQQFAANTTGRNYAMDGGVALGGNAVAQVSNASDATYVDVRYVTRGTEHGVWLNTSDATGAGIRSVTYAGVPETIRRPTDRYLLAASDDGGGSKRTVSLTRYASGDISAALPPLFGDAFSADIDPYLRPSYEFTKVQDASLYSFKVTYSPVRSSAHSFSLDVAPVALDANASQTLTFPDFSGVAGFNPAWVAPSNGSATVEAMVVVSKADANGTFRSESSSNTTVPAL